MCAVTTNEENFYSARQKEARSILLICIGVIKGLCEFTSLASFWNGKGYVGYVPAAYLMIIIDGTLQEEDSDTTREEGKGTDGTKIGGEMGQDGERRKVYSAAVIDGFKRKSTIYMGDSKVRKRDTRLSKGKDVVVCLPGARIEHVTESSRSWEEEMEGSYWYTSGRTTQTRKGQQR